MPLQSRNTPSKDALPQPAADDPPSTPREWLTPPFKEEFLATNTKQLVLKKRDALKGGVRHSLGVLGGSSAAASGRASLLEVFLL